MKWTRPEGPPRIWQVLEKINSKGKKMQFLIQEVPKDRYMEAIEFMCTKFIQDEAMSSSIDLINDPQSVNASGDVWRNTITKGISVAAYEIIDNNKENLVLAGLNVLCVFEEKQTSNDYDMLPHKAKIIFNFVDQFTIEANLSQLFNSNNYYFLGSYGLCVDPRYRGLGLGKELLKTRDINNFFHRDDIGRAYNISYTATVFSSATSQKIASSAGFQERLVRAYEDVVDDKGEPLFPSLKGEKVKLMVKRLQS